jgi:hypothetical protein
MRSNRGAAALPMALMLMASCGESRGTLVTTNAPPGVWQPARGAPWQVQLSGPLDTSFDVAVYDIDLFNTSAAEIERLHAAGRSVICYVSVGTLEPWRDDAADFPTAARGNPLLAYPDERWLDSRDPSVRALITARLDVARQKLCDGVSLSNISPDGADTGFPLALGDVLSYGRYLSAEAHRRGLGAGLGGGNDIAPLLQPDFEWAHTSSCLGTSGCGAFAGFLAAEKAVFEVEFGTAGDAATICPQARQAGVNTLIKNRSLDAFRVPCE